MENNYFKISRVKRKSNIYLKDKWQINFLEVQYSIFLKMDKPRSNVVVKKIM
jgi:hypothetical protein